MASTVSDIINKLTTDVVGTKTSNIDAKLDSALKDIVSYRAQNGRNSYIELVKSLVTKSGFDVPSTIGGISTATTPAALGQGGRIQRYKMYESITGNINYCKRALDVLTDNILSPDDITKISLEIRPKSVIEEDKTSGSNTRIVRDLIDKLKIERSLDVIVKNTLHLGDFFCEIADEKTALMSKAMILSESDNSLNESLVNIKDTIEYPLKESETGKGKIILDYSSFDDTQKNEKKTLENIKLLYYEPKRVVKLQSNMFPICFGYLIFPLSAVAPQLMIQDQIINGICSNILRSLEKKIPELDNNAIDSNDLRDVLRSMVKETDPSKIMNIRYVPPDRMVHFMVPSLKFYPYGESIFDASQFTAKCLIALETALAIHRLNRSIEKRSIGIETGLPRDSRKQIEMMKEEIRKRKISLDSFGTIDTIPSMVTSFEDLYVPMKDGKRFVEITTFQDAGADTRGKVDELRFMRDSVVASLGVPPSYINIEEGLSNKNALGEESNLFARCLIGHQKYFTHQIQELVLKIYQQIDPEQALRVLDDVSVNFPTPRSLQLEREAAYTSNAINLVQQLQGIGIPIEYSKKKYINADWEEVKKYQIDDKIDKTLGLTPPEDQSGMGGMMGGGMMGGGMPGGGMPPGEMGGAY